MKKKLLALALATTVVLTFAACGSKGNSSNTGSNNNSASTPTSSAAASTPSSSAEAPSSAESKTSSLEDWFVDYASDIKDLENQMNAGLAGSGVDSIKVSADGNIFVYEYYLDDSIDWSSIPTETVDEVFEGIIEEYSSSMSELFEGFEKDFGFSLDGLRFTFYNPDGSVFYTQDVIQ